MAAVTRSWTGSRRAVDREKRNEGAGWALLRFWAVLALLVRAQEASVGVFPVRDWRSVVCGGPSERVRAAGGSGGLSTTQYSMVLVSTNWCAQVHVSCLHKRERGPSRFGRQPSKS